MSMRRNIPFLLSQKLYPKNLKSIYKILFLIGIVLLVNFYLEFNLLNETHDSKKHDWIKHKNISKYFERAKYPSDTPECEPKTEVLLGLISAPPNIEAREALRITLRKYLPPTWTILFFVGISQNRNLESRLAVEKKQSKDIIQLEVEDSYANLTIKVSMLLDWMNRKCKQSKYFMKMDDDVYLNTKNMQHLLNCLSYTMEHMYSKKISPECEVNPKDIIGHYIDYNSKKYMSYVAAGYLYKGVKPDRDPSSKWYLSFEHYPNPTLPIFLSGTAYLISTNLIPHILNQVVKTPLINLEDVFITGIIMKNKMNLKLKHLEGFNRFRPQWDDVCLYNTFLTAHGLNPEEILRISQAVYNLKESCSPIRQIASYINKIISNYIPRYKL